MKICEGRLSRVLVGLAIAVLAIPAAAAACSCIPGGPPCQAYFESDAVFVGTVQSITVRKRPIAERAYDHKYVRVAIDGPSRGVQGSAIEIGTGMGGGDCGFDFKEGQRYVIYAWRAPDGTLSTGICSRTKLYSDAAEDVAYLTSGPPPAAAARVFGTIVMNEFTEEGGAHMVRKPVADVQVNVRGSAGVYSATTNAQGRYAIEGVRPGAYEVELVPPSIYSARNLAAKFEIKDARACRAQDFYLRYEGRILGTIVDTSGRPASGVRVEIAAPEKAPNRSLASPTIAKTNSSGQFELSDVQPGRYALGVGLTAWMDDQVAYPATWYPGTTDRMKSREIEIVPGARIQLDPWVVPDRLASLELSGTVVWPDGTPVADANVVLRAGFDQASEVVRTDALGAFKLRAFDATTYKVQAFLNLPGPPFRQAQGETTVRMARDLPPVRIVLSPR